jgi:hypothetical protein
MATKKTKSMATDTTAPRKIASVKKTVSKEPSTKVKPKSTGRKTRSSKSSASTLRAGLSLEPKKQTKEPIIAHDEIALRAYFIAERRQKMGWEGDSATDWSDAVSQLRAEALEKPLKKR